MKHSNIKLTNIIPNYTVFEENQVLTDDQLNTLMLHLDQQDRMSRLYLHGYGTVCGLKVDAQKSNTLTVSKGCGITTDGDLLYLTEGKNFVRFSIFDDKDAKYPLFEKTKVYKLLSEDEKSDNKSYSLRSFKRITNNNFNDYVILFYLESYLHDPDICTGGDCDNKGKFQINKKQFILVEKSVLDKAESRFYASKQYFKLKNVNIPRLKLGANGVDNYDDLVGKYKTVINTGLKDFIAKLQQTGSILKPFLVEHLNTSNNHEKWAKMAASKVSSGIDKKLHIQYVYDFVKDLGQAYNEFVEAIYNWETECMPQTDSSPKHLSLGDALARVPDVKDPHRQGFVQSPALNQSGIKLKKAIFLFQRIGEIIEHFSNKKYSKIILTPSVNAKHQLGERSIPFYYEMDKGKQNLYNNWSFDLTERSRETDIYSYHAKAYSDNPPTVAPLNYDLGAHDFFRIEGHLGLHVKTANTQLQKMVKDNNLPFKVVTVILEKALDFVYFKPPLRYYGMEIMHKIYRDELIYNLTELKNFNVKLDSTLLEATELPKEDRDSQREMIAKVNTSINSTKSLLAKPIDKFNTNSFKVNYQNMVEKSANLNKQLKKVSQASSFTPLEKAVNNISFSKLEWITDLVKKREEKAKEQSVFEQFISENHGMEHLAGVPKGGTFILVYSSSDSKVIADFSLPYYYYEMPVQEVAEGSETEIENPILDWKLKNDFTIYLDKAHILNDKLIDLDLKYKQLNLNFISQTANLSAQFGGINNAIQAIPNFVGDFKVAQDFNGVFDDPVAQQEYEILQDINGARDFYADKVKDGSATAHEKDMFENLEITASGAVENILKLVSERSDDIIKGGQIEMALNMVLGNASKYSGAAKAKVTLAISNSLNVSGGKDNFNNLLNIQNF